jgi:hypothetical protein
MRPKKNDENLKGIILQVRASTAEAEQFRAQAAARKLATSTYLRFLLLEDADRLSAEGKLRQAEDGGWEFFAMGVWKRTELAK